MTAQSKLIPALRDGVNVIKLIFYKALKPQVKSQFCERDDAFVRRFCGAVVNRLFGIPNDQPEIAEFAKKHGQAIETELKTVATRFETLRIPLTDALRIQFLCDDMEGIPNETMLSGAKGWGILIVDREVPFPRNFMNLVRTLGVAHGVLAPEAVELNADAPEPEQQGHLGEPARR